MGITDWFKPKYKHSNPDKRIAAIKEIEDNKILLSIVENDLDYDVQVAALKNISDDKILYDIVTKENIGSIVEIAFNEISKQDLRIAALKVGQIDNKLLIDVGMNDEDTFVRLSALKKLPGNTKLPGTDTELLFEYLSNDQNDYIREHACKRIGKDFRANVYKPEGKKQSPENGLITTKFSCDHCMSSLNYGSGYLFYSSSQQLGLEIGNLLLCQRCTNLLVNNDSFNRKYTSKDLAEVVEPGSFDPTVAWGIVERCKAHRFSLNDAKNKARELAQAFWNSPDKQGQAAAIFWQSNPINGEKSDVLIQKGDLVSVFILWSSPIEPPDGQNFFIKLLLELYPDFEKMFKKRPGISEPIAMAWITDPVESYDIVHNAKEKFGPQILDQTRYITSTRKFGGIASGFDGSGACLTVYENIATKNNKDSKIQEGRDLNSDKNNSVDSKNSTKEDQESAEILIKTGVKFLEEKQIKLAVQAFSAILIELPNAPKTIRTHATTGLAQALTHDINDPKIQMLAYTALTDAPETDGELRAKILYQRAALKGLDDVKGCIADFKALATIPEAPENLKADAKKMVRQFGEFAEMDMQEFAQLRRLSRNSPKKG